MNKLNTVGQRIVYEAAKNLLVQNKYNVEKAKLTFGHLRSESLMSTSLNSYPFYILTNDPGTNNGGKFATEVRLRPSDVFIVTWINLQCAKPASANDTAFRNLNYGNPNLFSTTGVPAAIEGAYENGNLNLIADNQQLLYKWPTKLHYKVPITQQNSWIQYSAATPVPLIDSLDGSDDGLIPCEPNIILSGNASLNFTFDLAGGMAAVETTGRWILELNGILAQNCSPTANNVQ